VYPNPEESEAMSIGLAQAKNWTPIFYVVQILMRTVWALV
jgi:hypothetical protein